MKEMKKMAHARKRPSGGRSGSPKQRGAADQDSNQDPRTPYRPAQKKGASPIATIAVLLVFLISGIVFVKVLVNRSDEPEVIITESDSSNEYNEIKRRIVKSGSMVRAVVKGRNNDDPKRFASNWSDANDYTGETLDKLRAMLEEVRNPDGTLPVEYSGYNTDFGRLQILLGDLIKVAPLDAEWDED